MQVRKSRFLASAVVAALVLSTGAAYAAFAAFGGDNDAIAPHAAAVPLSQAVINAEQKVGGKAVRAEYENTKAGWAYDVEVVKEAKVFDVRVDATSGSVISAVEDSADHDDGHDAKD